MNTYTRAVRKAIEKYGEAACVRAYELNTKQGEGAFTISMAYALPGINTTRQADSACAAGAAIVAARQPVVSDPWDAWKPSKDIA
jgi:hypothetical protein